MQYFNPYSLLKIEPESLFDIPKAIRAAKKRILADIELDDEIEFDGIKVSRSMALSIFEDLDSEQKRKFHASIFFDELFCDFLTIGKPDWFYSDKPKEYIFSKPFISFISPYYIYQFDKLLGDSIDCGDNDLVESLVRCPLTISSESFDLSYKRARNYFNNELQDLEEKLEELEFENDIEVLFPPGVKRFDDGINFYNPFEQPALLNPSEKFENALLYEIDLQMLNNLPNEFQLLRDNLARKLRTIAIEVNNKFDESKIALLIFRHAQKINIGSQISDLIDGDIEVIEQIVVRENLNELNFQIEKLKTGIKQLHFSSTNEISAKLLTIFDVQSINYISSTENNVAIISAAMKVCEVAWLLCTSYNSPNSAIEVIENYLQLKLSDASVSAALLNKLILVRSEIDRNWKAILNQNQIPQRKQPKQKSVKQFNTQSKSKVGKVSQNQTYSSATNMFDSYNQINNNSDGIFQSLILRCRNAGLTTGIVIVIFSALSILITAVVLQQHSSSARNDKLTQQINNQNSIQKLDNTNQKSAINSASKANVSRPKSGDVLMQESVKSKGRGELLIDNSLNKDAVAKLVDYVTGKTYRQVYIREHSQISIKGIRQGDFYLYFSTGNDYVSTSGTFLTGNSYSKFDQRFYYTESRKQYGVEFR